MNKRDWIVLAVLENNTISNQRDITLRTGYSLGLVNSSLKKLGDKGFITAGYTITDKAREYIKTSKPKRAVILAAGMGLRMAPISRYPKGLLQINDEPMIERIINQLHDVEIRDICIVTGYKNESFEYLTDKYNVELLYNSEYYRRDSLHSLCLAQDKLSNCYIVPCSVWFSRNPFNANEYFSWYAVSEFVDDDSYVRLNRKMELVYTDEESSGNSMVGLCYLLEKDAVTIRENLIKLDRQRKYNHESWEKALFEGSKMLPYARTMLGQSAYEITTYEQLRELDGESKNLQSKRLSYIANAMGVNVDEITDIFALSRGMTNHHLRFSIGGNPYLLRVPGEGSNEIINRWHEAAVYAVLEGKGLSDIVVAISPQEGYKINSYRIIARYCDPASDDDVIKSIRHLRRLHDMKLEVDHSFDVLERLEWFEKLRDREPSFSDYEETRAKIVRLLNMVKSMGIIRCLCHNDVADVNFLFYRDSENGDEKVSLINWEYGGMNDPYFDVSIFCIFANYSKEKIDWVADIYCGGKASDMDRLKFYIYAAAGGFLWSVWSEYKKNIGVNFGDYTTRQYRYAKYFYRQAMELAEQLGVDSAANNKP